MRSVGYLLVGGGLSSVRAAQQIRALDPDGSILIVSDEAQLPYDRPPLSKAYLAGEKQADEIVLENADVLAAAEIECVLSQAVTALDPDKKVVTLASHEQVHFDKALLATGGRPVRLDLPGADLAGIHYLRTIADADALAAGALPGRKAVVIGGGFIGLEVAATLRKRGLAVTVLEALPQVWSKFGNADLSAFVTDYCGQRGITFLTGTQVREFAGDGRVRAVVTGTGERLESDLVCVGVGIVPNVELAVDAGLDVDNGIVVDDHMRTSCPDIFAAGDVVNYYDPFFGRRQRVEHWGHAEHSGQIAGRNMAGSPDSYDLLSYAWSDIFDMHLEFAGDTYGHDRQLLRGSVSDGAFMILYLRENRVTAFLAINIPASEYALVRRMIQKKTDISGREDQLADTSVKLRSLL